MNSIIITKEKDSSRYIGDYFQKRINIDFLLITEDKEVYYLDDFDIHGTSVKEFKKEFEEEIKTLKDWESFEFKYMFTRVDRFKEKALLNKYMEELDE